MSVKLKNRKTYNWYEGELISLNDKEKEVLSFFISSMDNIKDLKSIKETADTSNTRSIENKKNLDLLRTDLTNLEENTISTETYEQGIKEFATGLGTDNSKIWLEHDTKKLTGQNDLSFKTIFGNQSLIGEGNIDLYRHSLTCTHTADDVSVNYIFSFICSKNTAVSSVDDLKTLMTECNIIKVIGVKESDLTNSLLMLDNNLIKIKTAAETIDITSISDEVTTV